MKFLDKIALNRLIAIITSFILQILKLFAPKDSINQVDKRPKFPWIRKQMNKVKKVVDDE